MERHQLNRADRAVADVVLDDIEAATRISIKDLSTRAQVSEPTVIRFSRRMGCDDFSGFKIRLAQDYANGRMYITAERTTPAEKDNDVADQVYEATTQALASAFAQRDTAALEKAAEIVHRGRRIFCFGVGGSSPLRQNTSFSAWMSRFRQRPIPTSIGSSHRPPTRGRAAYLFRDGQAAFPGRQCRDRYVARGVRDRRDRPFKPAGCQGDDRRPLDRLR